MSCKLSIALGAFAALTFLTINSEAAVITFEGVAPPGGVVSVNPLQPYTEQGFTLTPTNAKANVLDAAHFVQFPGNSSDWFGFDSGNTITLTGPSPFDLNSAVVGPSTFGAGVIDFTITGQVFGGGVLTVTFNNLTVATLEAINFNNLTSVTFSTTSHAGLDNVTINAIPEPASLLLVGTACATLVGIRRVLGRKAVA